MLTEDVSFLRRTDGLVTDNYWGYKKGVIWVELENGIYFTLCFPRGNGYFKYFVLPDLVSDRMIGFLRPTKVIGRPMDQILRRMGAEVREEGNLYIYMFDNKVTKTINPFDLMNKREKDWAIEMNHPICLVDMKGVVQTYWFNKGLVREPDKKISVSCIPKWME